MKKALLVLGLVGLGAVSGAIGLHMQRSVTPARTTTWVQISVPRAVSRMGIYGPGWTCTDLLRVTGDERRSTAVCFYYKPWFRGIGRDRRGHVQAVLSMYGQGCEAWDIDLLSAPIDESDPTSPRGSTITRMARTCAFELTIPLPQ